MTQPIYFLPDVRDAQLSNVAQTRAVLKERGLTETFADVPLDKMLHFEPPGRGPGDKAGTLLAYQSVAGEIPPRWGFYPDEQEWTAINDGLWIGLDSARPATPEDMKRRRLYQGYAIELGDGQTWVVPVVRRPDGSTELPTEMTWDATGSYIEPIKPAYRGVWESFGEVAKWFAGGMNDPFAKLKALNLCIDALSLNYRVSQSEQKVLGLIDSETYLFVLSATVDWPRTAQVIDAEKKRNDCQERTGSTPG